MCMAGCMDVNGWLHGCATVRGVGEGEVVGACVGSSCVVDLTASLWSAAARARDGFVWAAAAFDEVMKYT